MHQTVVIIGGNRGIGLGFVQYYLSQPEYSVIATYRDIAKIDSLKKFQEIYSERLCFYQLDIRDEAEIISFANHVKKDVDILILNAGIMRGVKGAYPPENTLQEARELMEVNAYAHDHLMRAFYQKLLKPHSCAVYISSTLSHSASNIGGRSHHYRASKAAGNILMQNWNIELARLWLEQQGDYRTRPCVFPISPGVVKTDMAGPNSTAPLTIEQSVQGMTKVIETVRKNKDCALYLYNGEILEFYPDPAVVVCAKQRELKELIDLKIIEQSGATNLIVYTRVPS